MLLPLCSYHSENLLDAEVHAASSLYAAAQTELPYTRHAVLAGLEEVYGPDNQCYGYSVYLRAFKHGETLQQYCIGPISKLCADFGAGVWVYSTALLLVARRPFLVIETSREVGEFGSLGSSHQRRIRSKPVYKLIYRLRELTKERRAA